MVIIITIVKENSWTPSGILYTSQLPALLLSVAPAEKVTGAYVRGVGATDKKNTFIKLYCCARSRNNSRSGSVLFIFFFNELERTGLWIKRRRTGREKATGRAAGFRRRFCRVSPSAGRAENLPRFFHVRKRIGDSFFFLNFISQLTSKPFYTERALDTLIVFEDPRSSRSRKPLKPFYWYSPVIGHSCEYFHTQKSNWLFFFFCSQYRSRLNEKLYSNSPLIFA